MPQFPDSIGRPRSTIFVPTLCLAIGEMEIDTAAAQQRHVGRVEYGKSDAGGSGSHD